MELTQSIFSNLAKKYGGHASWAVWNPDHLRDTQVISENLYYLKTSVIMVGLNISSSLQQHWSNFHAGRHDRKLMYAFNDSPYRGAYMTDIIKGEIEAKSERLKERIQRGQIDLQKHISAFRSEMDDLGVNKQSLFILFGGEVNRLFADWLAGTYPDYVACPHYSRRGTDAEWVEDSWVILQERDATTRASSNTLPFSRNDSMRNQLQKLKHKQNRFSEL
jgi:hypothetical protein